MTQRSDFLVALATLALVTGVSVPATAQLPAEATLDVAEEHTTAVLPAPTAHRLYVLDVVFAHLTAAKAYVIDGDKRDVLGMINVGYVPNLAVPPAHTEVYAAETYFSRGTRGTRTDVVTIFDPQTLNPVAEVILPSGRFLSAPKKFNAALTTDGRYLLSFNMAPSTTVSVVDVKARKYVGDIEIPGCALVYPTGPARFSSICSDGALLTATFDETGKASSRRSKPFFNLRNDPLFEHPAVARSLSRMYFVSYDGMVHPVDVSGAEPSFDTPWSMLDEKSQSEEWRPGGWQLAAVHPAQKRLFVLMHKGPRWTHKQAGEEVWIFDVDSKKRVGSIHLEEHAISVAVSQDANPLLYTLSEKASLAIFDVQSGKHLGTVAVGEFPMLLYAHGE